MDVKILPGPTKKGLKLKDALILCGENIRFIENQPHDYRKPKYARPIKKH